MYEEIDVSLSCSEGDLDTIDVYLCVPGVTIGGGAAKCLRTFRSSSLQASAADLLAAAAVINDL